MPDELVALDLKRFVLNAWEYYPELLRGGEVKYLGALAYFTARSGRAEAPTERTLLVDDWEAGSVAGFYGEELVEALGAEVIDVTGYDHIHAADLAQVLRRWPRIRRAVARASRVEGISLWHWAYVLLKQTLLGWSLRRRFAPSKVVSGNDNVFPMAKAKAAGARVVLIQNGHRAYLSDSAFVAADAYAAMSAGRLLATRQDTGCRFGRVEPLGSIRLARHQGGDPPEHDVLFVSSLEPPGSRFDRLYGHCYSMRYEREAIALVNRLAEASDLRVGYYPRCDGELEQLRGLGLRSDAVAYLERARGRVYDAVAGAEVVLSTCSTVGLEAIAMGKRVGYVNLSGNRALVREFAAAGLEHTGGELEPFVHALPAVEPTDFIIQREDPVAAMLATVGHPPGWG